MCIKLRPILTPSSTWRGEPGEQWSSAQGLESVLLSIQSLMGANPYTNEPGYEEAKSREDKEMQKHYIDKIQHETIRISVIQRLEEYLGLRVSLTNAAAYTAAEDIDPAVTPFEPFVDLCKRRFLWYFDSYLDTIQQGKKRIKDGKAFVGMPFESMTSLESNGMKGVFDYSALETRIHAVKAAIDKETERWAAKGLLELKNDSCVAANLQHQFKQVTAQLQYGSSPMDVTLEENNPFVWFVTYFGRPMTNLDGGVFRLRMSFSPSFPSEAPRVKLETKIFHECVASDGTLCYVPNLSKIEDVRSHIDAIIKALENDEPTYDPRKIVNPEATRLFWGKKPEDKKQYSRLLRRSVQQMME
ncbi:hypothetical protein Golomagni_06645 [Golovinomyces magnicellulatus]|nr:hypothetical protein Golomagni_06645 [Golovinomyces magnicellulatus]